MVEDDAPASSFRVLERAIERGRLAHSLLVYGPSLEPVEALALRLAERLFKDDPASAALPLLNNPDLISVRPAKKMRQISAESARELIRRIQHSPQVGSRKVALIYEADRMNVAAANIFLKTLEEPPLDTTILLLTSRPYSLLPTIRSRCLHFRIPSPAVMIADEEAQAWLGRFKDWLTAVTRGIADKSDISAQVAGLYGLSASFGPLLEGMSDRLWKEQSAALGSSLDEDEKDALEAGIRAEARQKMFIQLELAVREYATQRGGDAAIRALGETVDTLERSAGLLRVNFNESAALEITLLAMLRIWAGGLRS